jgi:hypothetical protein
MNPILGERGKPAPPLEVETCPRCGSQHLLEAECTDGPHHARLICGDCRRHLRFLPKLWSLERARSFVLRFGKHAGRSLGDLARSQTGRGYLAWLAANLDGNAAKAARIVLEAEGLAITTVEGNVR